MHGSTENQREQAANWTGAAIEPKSGDIVIVQGGRVLLRFGLKDAVLFVSGLSQLIAQHPQLQTPAEPTPQLVIAGSVPPFACY